MKNRAAARYTLKYATKAAELLECQDKVSDLIRVMMKSRLLSAFGDLHGKMGDLEGEERPSQECPECGTEKSLVPWQVIEYSIRRKDGPLGPSMIYDQLKKA